jgi:ssDNA-binding Zn-finger/Zn-ribbon topoisomerase 1
MHRIRFFILSAGGILLAAALIRFVIAAGSAQALDLPEPLLGFSIRYAVLMVGGIEFVMAVICFFGKNVRFQTICLAWLTTNFFVYWIGLFLMHYRPETSCIGSLTDPLQLSMGISRMIIIFIPLYLLLGSYWAATQIWLGRLEKGYAGVPVNLPEPTGRSQKAIIRTLKISCPDCQGHIEFPANIFGQRLPCPHCKSIIVLQKPKMLKISCASCDGHIEFPDYALGQVIACPHCANLTTLQKPL